MTSARDGEDEGRLLTKKPVYPGRTVKLFLERVALPNGHVTELEVVRHPGASCVLPVLDGHAVLVRQWRHAAGGWLLEAPAGKLDPGEAPEHCARRELREETGLDAAGLVALGSVLTTPGFSDERIHLYLARDAKQGEAQLAQDEVLSIERLPVDELVARCADGRIEDAKTLVLVARARLQGLI